MSARDELAAAVAELGALPMPTGDTTPAVMKPEQRKAIAVQIGDVQPATDALIGVFAESVANVRNHEHPSWEDLYCMNLTSYMGERMAPVLKRLLNAETEMVRLRARVAELEAGTPWERAVAGLNALVDADIAFWIEPDGHISGPFGDEHIEWDHGAARWRLVHDDEDEVHPPHSAPCRVPSSPDCTCPVTPEQARRIERDRPETATSHDCNLPLSRRLDCGHCPHEVCQDCDRCPHTCRCASPEDPHDSPLHHTYAEGRDLPPFPGACEACGDTDAQWCPDCAACRKGCFGGFNGNDCTHPNAPWVVAS